MTLPRPSRSPPPGRRVLTIVGAWVDDRVVARARRSRRPPRDDATRGDLDGAAHDRRARRSSTSATRRRSASSARLHRRPDARRIDAQYRRVGVTDPRIEISGARSIVETVGDQLNAEDAAAAVKATGYEGCWVLAMGTTDTANVAVGSPVDRVARIDRMLAVIGDDPILWVTVKTLESEGAWSNANMQIWNQTLREAQARYPNIRIYDWATVVQDAWFQDDGIHYTSAGNVERARLIADALLVAYPGTTADRRRRVPRDAAGPDRPRIRVHPVARLASVCCG